MIEVEHLRGGVCFLVTARDRTASESMNDRAVEFLDQWEADHVQLVPPSLRGAEAARLAASCREDAIRAGIKITDLERADNAFHLLLVWRR